MAEMKYTHAFFEKQIVEEDVIYRERDDKKYRGKIYCPECGLAKLTVRGSKKNKALVEIKGVEHAESCSYRLAVATPKQARYIFNESEDINKVFTKLFTRLFKNETPIIPAGAEFEVPANIKNVENKKTKKVLIPLTHVEKISSADTIQEQFFYGKVRTEISKLQNGNYVMKVLAPKSSFQYFTIEITEKTYKYIPNKLKNPTRKSEKGVFFLYFGKLSEDKRKFKSSKLRSANFLKTYLPQEDKTTTDKRKPKLNMQQLKLLKTKYNKEDKPQKQLAKKPRNLKK